MVLPGAETRAEHGAPGAVHPAAEPSGLEPPHHKPRLHAWKTGSQAFEEPERPVRFDSMNNGIGCARCYGPMALVR